MSFTQRFENVFRTLLPSPFAIAIVLTIIAAALSLIWGTQWTEGQSKIVSLGQYWERGLWESSLLVFAMQMMLMLVLGHTLALAPPISRFIDWSIQNVSSPSKAAYLVCLFTILVAFFNWGLGLIFGAIMARKVGESFARAGKALNYSLIGAAGYSGLMVWHGGISGSAPIKVAETDHLRSLMTGIYSDAELATLPEQIAMNETVFSGMNLTISLGLLILLPLFMGFIAGRSRGEVPAINYHKVEREKVSIALKGAERLDHSRIFSMLIALTILIYTIFIPLDQESWSLGFINPNYINLALLGLALLAHRNFATFTNAVDQAIVGASGILIQFPLYFGIMGIMKHSGLVELISEGFISISNTETFPLFTFMSAGIVNIFVPSGGGQWSIQGPIIIEACRQLGTGLPKSVMAMAYGDQLTNMLQPFWALPLLGITGLKARDILPYTLLLFFAGLLIFLLGLILF